MHRVYQVLGADDDNAQRNAWPLLSFLEVQQPDNELDTAQQEAGVVLEGWVQRFSMYKRGAVSTADDDFKLRHVEVERQVLLFVSADTILMKQDAGAWQIADETL
ncbi:hypothetical protein LJJ44_06790 [Pseudomonas sp. B24_DOA]|nr:hypothetical protein LJJ44_06790 [Pseudomonas sp. B24_DOA]